MNCFTQGRKEESKMSKLILSMLLIMVLVISVVVISGCSGKKSNNTTGLTFEDSWDVELLAKNWDIGVFIHAEGYWECCCYNEYREAYIFILELSEDGFTTEVTLRINGIELELEYDTFYDHDGRGGYLANYDFKRGDTYRVTITHAGRNHEVNIKVPNELKITSTDPAVFNPAASFRVNWTMQGNTSIQGLERWAGIEGDHEYALINLLPSARNYTLPVNTIPQDFEYAGIGIWAINYATSGRVLFFSVSNEEYMELGYDNYSRSRITRTENRRERVMRAVNLIQNSKR